jgi:hypothetical protein
LFVVTKPKDHSGQQIGSRGGRMEGKEGRKDGKDFPRQTLFLVTELLVEGRKMAKEGKKEGRKD